MTRRQDDAPARGFELTITRRKGLWCFVIC